MGTRVATAPATRKPKAQKARRICTPVPFLVLVCELTHMQMSCRELDKLNPAAANRSGRNREAMAVRDGMGGMMDGMGGMWGMGLLGLLAVIVLVLAIAALVKYVFFR